MVLTPGGDGRSRALDAACALLAAVLGLVLARALAHGDLDRDGLRFQVLLRNHLVCEHPVYFPAIRACLALVATPEEAMRWLSALGAAGLGLGTYLAARTDLPPPGSLALAASVSCSASALYHGGATELHAFHGGFAALWLARCLRARGRSLDWLDAVLLLLTAGSHSSGGIAAMAWAAVRAERAAASTGLGFLASRQAWSLLLRSFVFAALPLVLAFLIEPRLMRGYVAFVVRHETGGEIARIPLVPYLFQQLLLPAPVLVAMALGLALWPRTARGSAPLLAFAGFCVVYGSIGTDEAGGYFLPLLPLCAWLIAGSAAALALRVRITLLALVLAVQTVVGFATREQPPPASPEKLQQRGLVERLPSGTLLILHVPYAARWLSQNYLWEVHDPTRDNTALFEDDRDDILAPEFRADPQAALLARVRAHRAAGRPVFMIDPAPFAAMATAGPAALAALAREFATNPAGPALPGLVRLQ
jgi:hypothetical protein